MLSSLSTGEPITDLLGEVMAEPRPKGPGPWVMINMITSLDGGTTVSGGSTGLGDADDRALFHALRAVPDFILVGAGTVRSEDYRPLSLAENAVEARRSRGASRIPRLVIVSGRLSLDPGARVFTDPDNPVLILGRMGGDPATAEALAEVAEVRLLDVLDGSAIVGELNGIVLCEGGPQLNGELAAHGLIDEINWTVAPLVVSGDSKRMVAGPATVREMRLTRAWQGDRSLFLRYVGP